MTNLDEPTYTDDMDVLESWERHLQRLDAIIEDLPESIANWDHYGLLIHRQAAMHQVATRRNKLFPEEKNDAYSA